MIMLKEEGKQKGREKEKQSHPTTYTDGDSSIYNSIIMYNCNNYEDYFNECLERWHIFLQHPNVIRFKEQFARNPFLRVATSIVIASLLAPVLLFIVLAVVSAVFAFVGFMVIQVTILAIGATILSCILFCAASSFTIIALCTLFIYYTLHYASQAFKLLAPR